MEENVFRQNHRILRVCLTGGPCAGKTTARKMLTELFGVQNYILYFIPEVPTLSASAGVDVLKTVSTSCGRRTFTENTMRLQMEVEDYFYRIAQPQDRDVIIICDRGSLDCLAYTPQPIKEQMLAETGWTITQIRDKRYDAVIHLVSAADGAEQFYTLDNNDARTETAEEARAIDKKTQEVWKGHPNFIIVDNEGVADFRQKIQRVYHHISKLVEFPSKPVIRTTIKLTAAAPIQNLPAQLAADRFTQHTTTFQFKDTNEELELIKRVCYSTKEAIYYRVARRSVPGSEEVFEQFDKLSEDAYQIALSRTSESLPQCEETQLILLTHENCWMHLITRKSESGALETLLKVITPTQGKKFTIPTFLNTDT